MLNLIIKNFRTSFVGLVTFVAGFVVFLLWLMKSIDTDELAISFGAIASFSASLNGLLAKDGQLESDRVEEAAEYDKIIKYENSKNGK